MFFMITQNTVYDGSTDLGVRLTTW